MWAVRAASSQSFCRASVVSTSKCTWLVDHSSRSNGALPLYYALPNARSACASWQIDIEERGNFQRHKSRRHLRDCQEARLLMASSYNLRQRASFQSVKRQLGTICTSVPVQGLYNTRLLGTCCGLVLSQACRCACGIQLANIFALPALQHLDESHRAFATFRAHEVAAV